MRLALSRAVPLAVGLAVLLLSLPVSGESPTAINNATVHPKPFPAPPLPPAGQSYVDPVFGTRIIRVTDERDGPAAQTLYSYWPAFNKDATLFVIILTVQRPWGTQSLPYLYAFDPRTETTAKLGPLWGRLTLQRAVLWSGLHPHIAFSLDDTGKLYRFDVLSKTYTVLKDFAEFCPAACQGWQPSKSADDRFFAFHLNDKTQRYRPLKAVAWDSALDRVYTQDLSRFTYYDEAHIDKSGRWVFLRGRPDNLLWDFAAGTTRALPFIGHYDVGDQSIVGVGTSVRDRPGHRNTILHDFGASRDVFYYPPKGARRNWQTVDHVSMQPGVPHAFLGTYAAVKLRGFVHHADRIYRRDGASRAVSNVAFPPDVLRHNGRDLIRVDRMPDGPGEWYLDRAADAYFVRLYADADATDTGGQHVTLLDWFPGMDEIVQVWTDGSLRFRRLAHHRSGFWIYDSSPRGSVDPTGRYFIYTSNWDGMKNPDGSPRTDVFILRIPPLPEAAR